jgi:membrane associated rhomboid family serine protease
VLISVNAVVFLIRIIAKNQIDLAQIFGLSSESIWPMIWQPLTYMFVHGDFFHIFMNMFVLWMFGSELESIWGRDGFIKYYFTTGVGSGLVWLLFNVGNPYTVLIGASGAIYGLL